MATSGTLSSVTLSKIEARRESNLNTDTDTLVCLEDIRSQIRCIEAVTTKKQRRTLWMGDKEGGIVIRDACTLRPLYQIERKSYNAFVNCIRVAGEGRVWTGLSDGTVRVFDASSFRLVDDFKAHGSEVTDMVVAHMPTSSPDLEHHMQVVITASADWSMAKWDAGTGQCLGRLQGHNNTVRCLCPTADGEFLISGGDDGCTRLWSLSANREITYENQPEPCSWPMTCHQGASVAGLAIIQEKYFVSVGKDGTAHVCTLDGQGQWLKQIEKRPCALTSVLFDASNCRIWIGGIDGIISVIDGQGPEFSQLATVHDHSGAYVSVLRSIGRYITHNVWTLTSDGVLCRFAESNAQYHGYHPKLMAQEDENTYACEQEEAKIDSLRERVVSNYNNLQSYRKDLNDIERIDSRNFALIAKSSANTGLKRKYFYLAMKWLNKQRTIARCEKAVEMLSQSVTMQRLKSLFMGWMTAARHRSRQHTKAVFAEAMLTAKDALNVQRSCVKLMEAALVERIRKSLVNVLAQHAKTCSNYIRQQYFQRWMEFRTQNRTKFMKRQMLNSILRGPREAMIRKYWNALMAVRLRKSALGKQLVISSLLFKNDSKDCMARYFTKWIIFLRHRYAAKRQLALEAAEFDLALPQNRALGIRFFAKWLVLAKAARYRRAKDELAATDAEIKSWEDTLKQKAVNEEDINRAMAEAEAELARQKATLADMQRTTRGAQRKVHEIKREIAMVGYADQLKPNAPLSERVEAVMLYFRAKGVGGVVDYASVYNAKMIFDKNVKDGLPANAPLTPRGTAAKKPKVLLPPFEAALKALKLKLYTIIKSKGNSPIDTEEPWDWGMLEEWVARLRGKDTAEVIDALRQLIVMYDGCTATRKPASDAALNEFLWNAYLLMPLVTAEAQKSSLDYVKEPDAPPPVEASPPPSPRRPASPTQMKKGPASLTARKGSPAPTARKASPTPTARKSSPPRPSSAGPSKVAPRPTPLSPRPTPSAQPGKVLGTGSKPWLGFKIKVTKKGSYSTVTLENCVEGGPADVAGLREGDELIRFGGVAVTDTRAFNAVVSRFASKPGVLVTASVSRGGKSVDIPITVGAKD